MSQFGFPSIAKSAGNFSDRLISELRQYAVNHVAVDVCQTTIDAVVTDRETPVINSELMQDRGPQVVNRLSRHRPTSKD